MITGEMVADAARQYIGTPIVEFGRSREGCDCVGLVLGVARDLELSFPQDITGYYLNIWRHPRLCDTRDFMSEYMDEVTGPAEAGDVILFGLGRSAIALSVGIVTATKESFGSSAVSFKTKCVIQKMVGGLHEEGPYFAEYDFIEGRYAVAGCYRFREI